MPSTKSWGSGSGSGDDEPVDPGRVDLLGGAAAAGQHGEGEEDGTGTQEPQGRGVHAPSMAQRC